jgi:hypothetical protein
MPYDFYPAVDDTYDFAPLIRQRLAVSPELRSQINPMTEPIRNSLLPTELWDGRVIVNTTTDKIERYNLETAIWHPIAEAAELNNYVTKASQPTGPTGFRNVIRNGDMQIAQRGDGPHTVDGGYTVDGWILGGIKSSVSRIASVPGVAGFLLATTITGQIAGDDSSIGTAIEGVETLAGKTATLSFWAKASTGTPTMNVVFRQNFGASGSPFVEASLGVVTLSTTLTKYTLTGVVPSIAGKTAGAGSNLAMSFWLSGRFGVPIQNGTFYITDVQLEEGPVATPFERLPVQQQLAWCQRYFQRIGANNPHMPWEASARFAQGYWIATPARAAVALPLAQRMRVKGTMTGADPGSFGIYDGVSVWSVTGLAQQQAMADSVYAIFDCSSAAGVVLQKSFEVYDLGNAYIDFSAEL